jgi:hypothetical protein
LITNSTVFLVKNEERPSMTRWLFAYGGLMITGNRMQTVGVTAAGRPLTVHGLRRSWSCAVPAYGLTSLSLGEDSAAQTVGVLTVLDAAQWAALDVREQGYRRVTVMPAQLEGIAAAELAGGTIETYVALRHDRPSIACPIVQSEIDAWIGGCLQEYGAAFARAVLQTTHGWDGPRLNDRAAPRYPFGLVDAALQREIDALTADGGGISRQWGNADVP